MPHLIVSARAQAVVEARPRSKSVAIRIGEALISLDAGEAAKLGEDLMAAAAPSCLESISGPVTVTPDHANEAVVIAVAGRTLLEISPSAWALLAMQGSSAALELRANHIRTGMRIGPLQLGSAHLVEAQA
ncbi:hypothetical protein [Stenotrophomonas sp. Ste96]|uniref:hypothetical protein n=1 Tax=Stenotrophomonas sp. Ste96 TaxID=2926029 RepID=UPI0021C8FBAA|nr:hypothetical protein [Stenotrophomonas sp. Ste96]